MSIRTERVAAQIRDILSTTLLRDIDTQGFGLLTVTEVKIAPDLRSARVFVSHFHSGKTDPEVLAFLDENTRELRMAVGREVRLKFTPELHFEVDHTLDRVERLEELIRKIHEDDAAR
jgi:ribosome-binding factor A